MVVRSRHDGGASSLLDQPAVVCVEIAPRVIGRDQQVESRGAFGESCLELSHSVSVSILLGGSSSSPSFGTMATPWRGVTRGQQIAICNLIYFFVHGEPCNETSQMLSRLLSYTTRLIVQIDTPSPSLSHFMQVFTAALKGGDPSMVERTTASIESHIRASSSFAGLHNFFTKVERLLMTEELYDEVQNVTIKPADRLIDEQSPFGMFLQRCLDEYINLEDNDFARVVYHLQGWVKGEGVSEEEPEHDVPATSRDVRCSSQALQRGDYASARAELEGFFDRSPHDQIHQSLQETLYKNAVFHYQTKAYESAKSSLNEALRLSRGVHDLQCITDCHTLLRLVEYEEEIQDGGSTSTHRSPALDAPLLLSGNELWKMGREIDQGHPLLSILESTQKLLGPTKGKMQDHGLSSTQIMEANLWQGSLWTHLGSDTNARMCKHFSLSLHDRAEEIRMGKIDLAMGLSGSDSLATGLRAVFDSEKISSLNLTSYEKWQRSVWAMVNDASAGNIQLQEAIRLTQPESVRGEEDMDEDSTFTDNDQEENEATFGVNNKLSLSSYLRRKLKEAKKLREEGLDSAAALVIAIDVMRRGKEAQLFVLHREALVEYAEVLLDLGKANRARAVLDEAMPQLLMDVSAKRRGSAAWVYARALLALSQQGQTTLPLVLPWLERANRAFRECDCLRDLADVLYIQMRLCEHLEKPLEGQLAERDLHAVEREEAKGAERSQRLIDSVQSLVTQVGSRVIAGG